MTMCGSDCCKTCGRLEECGGCEKVKGHPFGGNCVVENCISKRGKEAVEELKKTLIQDINVLGIQGLVIDELHQLNGFYVNLEFPLSNHSTVKFLNDNDVYWGNQIEKIGSERCFGVVANEEFILVCEYGCNGSDPELLLFKRR